ncbi:hypothetical protein ACP4OV_008287 [Aristida adscensionis]
MEFHRLNRHRLARVQMSAERNEEPAAERVGASDGPPPPPLPVGGRSQEMPAERDEDPAAERVGLSDGPPPPPLRIELQLDIVARSEDIVTILRCAAASKPLRRGILDKAFRDRLALRAEANGGFDPALLVAVSYRLIDRTFCPEFVHVSAWPPSGFRFDTDLLQSFQIVSSRDSLLVLGRDHVSIDGSVAVRQTELHVCNTFTGHVTSVPRMHLWANSIFCPALLTSTVSDAPLSCL